MEGLECLNHICLPLAENVYRLNECTKNVPGAVGIGGMPLEEFSKDWCVDVVLQINCLGMV